MSQNATAKASSAAIFDERKGMSSAMRFYIVPFLALFYVSIASIFGVAALYATLPLLAVSFIILDAACGAVVQGGAPDDHQSRVLPWLYIPLQITTTVAGAVIAARPG